jgi:hypothetical protein
MCYNAGKNNFDYCIQEKKDIIVYSFVRLFYFVLVNHVNDGPSCFNPS